MESLNDHNIVARAGIETREATANDSFRRGQYYSDSDANTATVIDFKTPIRAGSIDAYSTVLLIVDVAI